MTYSHVRRLGAGLLAATGALHIMLAPEYLEEKAYIGMLFVLGGVVALVVATRLWTENDRIAWSLGAAIAAGMAIGFVLSRTVGLPGFHESDWELSGVASLLIEIGYLGALASYARRPARVLQAS